MALLSEDDRKLILGSNWKPLPPSPDESRKQGVILAVVAVLVVTVVAYFIVTSSNLKVKVTATTPAVAASATAAPSATPVVR